MLLGIRTSFAHIGLQFLIVWLFCISSAWANTELTTQQCLETNSTISGTQLLPYMTHFWDPAGDLKAPDINRGFELTETAQRFTFEQLANSGNEATLGRTNSNHWLQFCLRNQSNQIQNLVVSFEPPSLSLIEFYPQKIGLPSFKTGNTKKMDTRDIPTPDFDFNVRLLPKEQQTFYLRIYADRILFLRANLWDRVSFEINNNKSESGFGIFVGVLMGLVIYNILLFASARQTLSLIYIGWSISVFLLLASVNGRFVQYLAPNFPHLGIRLTEIFSPISIYLFAFLCQEFIQLKNYRRCYQIGRIVSIICLIPLILFYLYNSEAYVLTCIVIAVLFFAYYSLIMPIYALIKDRLAAAKYVLIIQTPLIAFIVDRGLFGFNITQSLYIPYKLTTAIVPAMILISYYIGLMVYREKEAAKDSALKHLNISNNLKSKYNTQLEKELEQKTTDIRLLNSDLERQAKKLIQIDESKSKFFANISHELRTPLTLIEGPLNMLLEQGGLPEKQTLESIVRNSNSLKRLIDQILLLSELDENSLELKSSKVNIVQTVHQFSAQFSSLFEQKGVRLNCISKQSDIQAYVDFEKLQMIINNLLSNSFKFTEDKDHVTVNVSTESSAEGEYEYSSDQYVDIVVSDTGQGIQDDELEHIFDRYYQADSSEQAKSGLGTGIGLSLVKELVELHAGEITVKSVYRGSNNSKQSGTTFYVKLPLGRAHLNANELVQSIDKELQPVKSASVSSIQSDNVEEPTNKSDKQLATILIVDDNQDMRHHIRQLLETDYNIITAEDGILAEKVMGEQLPDLIVTDLMMPNRNGLEFIQSIKKNSEFAKVPVIMLTARAGLNDRINGLVAAIDDYLVKPFNGRELKIRIQNLLNKQAQFRAFYQNSLPLFEATSNTNQKDSSVTYIDKVKAIVNQRLMDSDFGVVELAEALHVSEATLRRRLADQANFSPAAFIRHCRLDTARQLASQGNMRSITELAHAVGFNETSYFARLYKKTFNEQISLSISPKTAK